MKRILIILTTILFIATLSACDDKETVIIPNFYSMEYGDVVRWGSDNDIAIKPQSEYTDLVKPYEVFAQDIEAGTEVEIDTEVIITYSRGYDPKGEIELIDFTGMTVDEIKEWLIEVDINKYHFLDSFDPTIGEGEFVRVEVQKMETRDINLRNDTYYFYYSRGELVVPEIDFYDPSTVRGVNLGGWFLLEGWMTPELFEGVNGSDETAFLRQKPNAEEEIKNHWETFITEDDFKWLSDHGVEYVRLPIPWWMWGVENAYEGREFEVDYIASVTYIDRAMTWAEDYDIKVLVDLHALPGCQNGFDNGGISHVVEWFEPDNVDKTLEIIEMMAIHFSQFDSFWGFEVINEPTGWGLSRAVSILQEYYEDAYFIIRQYNSEVWIGFHDGFRSYMKDSWENFFTENDYMYNVFFDIHLYHVFGEWKKSNGEPFTIHDHLDWVEEEDHKHIRRYEGIVPVVIGEWSAALPGDAFSGLDEQSTFDVKQAFANAQMNAFEDGMGWFFWNYRIDADSHKEWDFRRMVELGYFPEYYTVE